MIVIIIIVLFFIFILDTISPSKSISYLWLLQYTIKAHQKQHVEHERHPPVLWS